MKLRKPYPPRIKYDIGMRFHNFVIIDRVESIISHGGRSYTAWKCKCDCGKEFIGRTKEIQKGCRKSCGCLSKSSYYKVVSDEQYFTNVKLNHYRNSAKRRNHEWKLDNKYFFNLITGNCYYCGSKPSLENKRKTHFILLNGIDRIDSNKGYIADNVVSCCKFCNFAKGNSSSEEFENWIKRLIKYRKNENNNNF